MSERFRGDQIRAWLDRAWPEVRDAKQKAWASDAREGGPAAGLNVSGQLWNHARSLDPAWPGEAARTQDLEHHRQLSGVLDRLRHVQPRR